MTGRSYLLEYHRTLSDSTILGRHRRSQESKKKQDHKTGCHMNVLHVRYTVVITLTDGYLVLELSLMKIRQKDDMYRQIRANLEHDTFQRKGDIVE